MKKYFFLMVLWISFSAQAAKVHGRFTVGGYQATERFSSSDSGSDNNDVRVLSARLYTRVSDLGESGKWDIVSDLRDTHDFFDKLDRERFQLTAANTFQIRQLATNYNNEMGGIGGSVGRFPVTEAGAVHVDGAALDYRWRNSLDLAVFGGLNPKRVEQTYLRTNSESNIFGSFLSYQPKELGWGKNFFLTHAFISESFSGEVDRRYLFHNMIYQWQPMSRIISLVYYDTVPRSYIQTANLNWQQSLGRYLTSQLNYLAIDVIEYRRRQGLRESLVSSPYKETWGKLDFLLGRDETLQFGYLTGRREADGLGKSTLHLRWMSVNTFGPKWDSYVELGTRKNFVSQDQFSKVGLGYFSRNWETQLDIEYGLEKYEDGTLLHPLVSELAVSNFFSKTLFSTFSVQRAADENVTIYAAFFKIGYRFGNREISPIRDGAPPRGAL